MTGSLIRIKQAHPFDGNGFTFTFPEFEGWELIAIQRKAAEISIIFINWPSNIEFEVAPQTVVRKIAGLAPAAGTAGDRNADRIAHARVYDPSLYVQGHKPGPGLWDHIEFYGPVFGVRITPFRHEGAGYADELFTQTVIDSFRFAG